MTPYVSCLTQTCYVALALVKDVPAIFGIDIGGTKCAISRLMADGQVDEICRFETGEPLFTLNRCADVIEQVGSRSVSALGIACGGPMNARKGLILRPPNLPNWKRVSVSKYFEKRLGKPAFLMNDANANALAEWQFGAGRGCQSMVFLTAGTGMGAGLIINGRLHVGVTGDAGEVGHWRLADVGPKGYNKAGSFEGYCSGGA